MRPIPMPAPMSARPIPMPAPSSALLLSAVFTTSAAGPWSSMRSMCIVFPLMFVLHESDEHGREKRKDICLQESHEQLEDHEVPSGHVREQPEAEGERLDEFPDQLDRGHDECHDHRAKTRHAGRDHDDGLEVPLGPQRPEPRYLDHQEREEGQGAGHREVTGRRSPPREKTEQVAVQNEEEERLDERDELLTAVADARERHVVAHEQDDRLDSRAESARSFPFPLATRDLTAGNPDRQEDEECGEQHEHDVFCGRNVDVRAGDVPGTGQVYFAKPRQLEDMAIRRVLEDDLADIGSLDHLRNLVSRNNSGNRTPKKPNTAGSGGNEAGWVRTQITSAPNARNLIPIPPNHRAMNAGLGARIFGLSNTTAHSCAINAVPPPIAATLPPIAPAIATRTIPRPSSSVSAFTDAALPRLSPSYRS